MPKKKGSLSNKHEYCIDKLNDIPSVDEIKHCAYSRDLLSGIHTDFRYNTEDVLLMLIEALTKNTQMEDIGLEISEKARAVFDYYSEKDW